MSRMYSRKNSPSKVRMVKEKDPKPTPVPIPSPNLPRKSAPGVPAASPPSTFREPTDEEIEKMANEIPYRRILALDGNLADFVAQFERDGKTVDWCVFFVVLSFSLDDVVVLLNCRKEINQLLRSRMGKIVEGSVMDQLLTPMVFFPNLRSYFAIFDQTVD